MRTVDNIPFNRPKVLGGTTVYCCNVPVYTVKRGFRLTLPNAEESERVTHVCSECGRMMVFNLAREGTDGIK